MRGITPILLVLPLSGCALFAKPEPQLVYADIPAAYLQACEVPALPEDNGGLSEAFVIAARCALQGNTDKGRIRELTRP